jgi:hypothetical protein
VEGNNNDLQMIPRIKPINIEPLAKVSEKYREKIFFAGI